MLTSLRPFSYALLALIAIPTATTAQQWTRFRGPNGAGVSDATTVPTTWTDADYNWKIKLPGTGHSSPVIWGKRLFVTACDEEQGARKLLCIDTGTGDIQWTHAQDFRSYKKHKNNSFASSTPAVDEKHVYTIWHSQKSSPLIALTHEGEVAWTFELGPYLHGQGGATSPIVYDDIVVLANDQKQPSFLIAVDRNSGKERWRIDREGKRACYSTPCIFKGKGGEDEIVFAHCYEGIIGVDPKTGRQKWHIDVFGRTSQRALGSPVVSNELVYATSGAVGGDRQLVAIRPESTAADTNAVEAWRTNKQIPHVPTPIVFKDWLFLWSDQGVASCLNKSTGATVWKERVGGNYFSSPICIDGWLYNVDLDGRVVVIAAADQFKLLGKTELGEGSKATPAVSDGVLYLRTESTLFSIGGK